MDYHVIEARHVSGHKIWLRFRDGREGLVDLEGDLIGPVFEPPSGQGSGRISAITETSDRIISPNIRPDPSFSLGPALPPPDAP